MFSILEKLRDNEQEDLKDTQNLENQILPVSETISKFAETIPHLEKYRINQTMLSDCIDNCPLSDRKVTLDSGFAYSNSVIKKYLNCCDTCIQTYSKKYIFNVNDVGKAYRPIKLETGNPMDHCKYLAVILFLLFLFLKRKYLKISERSKKISEFLTTKFERITGYDVKNAMNSFFTYLHLAAENFLIKSGKLFLFLISLKFLPTEVKSYFPWTEENFEIRTPIYQERLI